MSDRREIMAEFQPVRFGKYLLVEKLATGGMAQLYRGKIVGVRGFEKFIAIKMILPHLAEEKELVNSFIDEAKLAALLNHQNIVQIYDFGSIENSYFITMEYLHGRDLRHVLAKSKERGLLLPLEISLYVASRICAGLAYAHTLKDFQGKPLHLIHRDISPQNIFLTYEGGVKIVDFGIAKAASQSTITQIGMIKGKVAYMSPEQACGIPIDHRSDIFSVGVLLYEMITGNRMFTGEDTMQILAKVRDADYLPLESARSGLHPEIYQTLNRALAQDPAGRYPSADEMMADLEECIFRYDMRPSARGVTDFMKELFQEEIAAERERIRESASVEIEEPPGEIEEAEPPPPAGKREGESPLPAIPQPTPKGKGPIFAIAAAALLFAAGGGYFLFRPSTAVSPSVKTETVVPAAPDNVPGKETAAQAEARELVRKAMKVTGTRPDEAKALLLQAIGLDPADMQSYFQLGMIHVRQKSYPEAIAAFRKVTELGRDFPDGYFNLGYVYAVSGENARAEEMYARVVELSPAYLDEALFNLGIVQEKQGKVKESIESIERAVAVNPGNKSAERFLAKLKRRR